MVNAQQAEWADRATFNRVNESTTMSVGESRLSQANLTGAQTQYRAHKAQLYKFMSVVLVSGISVGYGLAYSNNTMPVINAIYGWETQKEQATWDSLYGSMYALGAGIGCSYSGKFI